MTITLNGTTGITTPALDSVAPFSSADMPAGSVLQVVVGHKKDTTALSPTGGVQAIPNLAATITPRSSSSKILVQMNITSASSSGASQARLWLLYRNGANITDAMATQVGTSPVAWVKTSGTLGMSSTGSFNSDHGMGVDSGAYLDSPNSTSALTYQVYCQPQSNAGINILINRNGSDQTDQGSNAQWEARSTSTIILMEIAG